MNVTDLMVCTDCAMIIANGTVGNEDYAEDAAHAARMAAHLGPDDVRPGTLVSGSGPDEDFSTSPCEACGDPLAGTRMPAAILTLTREVFAPAVRPPESLPCPVPEHVTSTLVETRETRGLDGFNMVDIYACNGPGCTHRSVIRTRHEALDTGWAPEDDE